MTDGYSLAVIGGGLIGLATARAYLRSHPNARVIVLEKEETLAMHQSGRNSGVIHAGLYYTPGSLKARLCREGRELLLAFADEHAIEYRLTGKLVVALHEGQLERLAELARRGQANGLAVRELARDRFEELEPHVAGIRALHVPESGIIDFRRVTAAYATDVETRGGEVRRSALVSTLEPRRGAVRVHMAEGDAVEAKHVVACVGVHSDRLVGPRACSSYRIAPFRGDYLALSAAAADRVRGLVYPVPDPALPFLGVHFTRRLDGEVWAGPNAILALHRESLSRLGFRWADAFDAATFPGTWRLLRRYWRTAGGELFHDLVRRAAVKDLRRYLPGLDISDVIEGPRGIRAQLLARDGTLVDDFRFVRRGPILHVLNAPSPGATASLAIGEHIVRGLSL